MNWIKLFTLAPYISVLLSMYLGNDAFGAILLYNGAMAVAIFLNRKRINWNSLRTAPKWKLLSGLLPVYAVSGIVIWHFWPHIVKEGVDYVSELERFGLAGSKKLIFLIYFSTVHPILEELFWRFVLTTKRSILSPQEFLFAGYHLLVVQFFIEPLYLAVTFVALVIAARFWRFMKENLNQEISVIITHLVADFSIMYAMLYLLK